MKSNPRKWNRKYAQIVFAQGDDAIEPLKIYDEQGKEAAITYLAQWDNGKESEHDLRDKPSKGTRDRSFEVGEYILTVNQGLGYIGLERIVFETKKNPEDEMEEPDEEDIFFSPAGPLGAWTSVSAGGKHIGTFKSDDNESADDKAYAAAKKWAKKSNFYPSAWQVSDHGNYHLISGFWKEGNPGGNRYLLGKYKTARGEFLLYKGVETTYHPSSKSSKIRGKISYSFVGYPPDSNEPSEELSRFGFSSAKEMTAEFRKISEWSGKVKTNPSSIYQLVKHKGRWAIYDTTSRVYYYGKKASLEKRIKELNAKTPNPNDEELEREFLIDEARGVYVPKKFAELFDMRAWHVDEEDEVILLKGPDAENYWEAWEDVLAHAYIIEQGKKWTLEQDGDLFAVHYKE